MTRHLCPAEIFVGPSTAAGVVAVLRAAATATQLAATTTAIHRDEGILRRIGCPFPPRVRALELVSENVSGSVNTFVTGKSSAFSQIAWKIVALGSGTFRNLLE